MRVRARRRGDQLLAELTRQLQLATTRLVAPCLLVARLLVAAAGLVVRVAIALEHEHAPPG